MRVTITGDNVFIVMEELKKLVQSFVGEHGDLAVEQIDANETDMAAIQEALTSLPFLASIKMVVLRDASQVTTLAQKLPELIDELPETTDLLIVETHIDKRITLYKYLKSKTDFREFKKLDQPGAVKWLVKLVGEQGGSIGVSETTYLVERIGLDQARLYNEISKLLLYNPKITRQSIELLTEASPQSTIFELLESAFAGNNARTLRLYGEQRQQSVEPQQIIAMLTWQLHTLAIIQAAGERSQDQIAKEAKLNPFVVRKSLNLANGLSKSQVALLARQLLELDVSSKSRSIDLDDALQHYLLALA